EALAAAVGLPAAGLTLAALAARAPGPAGDDLLAARARLAAATAELAGIQQRYANLAFHLRSYFRGVMSALTAAGGPSRYGPTGAVLGPAGGTLQTRG
ncbi:MAG TPA: hypothetical protein VH092_11685, partial [Urbifossiella sp.]|nr:hypothetical protein [Urbifossiella sp.]